MKHFIRFVVPLFLFVYAHSAFAAATTSISQNGVVWTFASSTTYGQFVNGDYWVLAPVTITSITPDFTGSYHGWQINPTPSGAVGFDSGVSGFNSAVVPTLPYTVSTTTQSIVKAVSRTGADRGSGGNGCESGLNQNRNCLNNASVLTVVTSAPVNDGTTVFRPPYIGTSKPYYSTTTIDYTKLRSLTATSLATTTYTHEWVISQFSGPYLDHLSVTANQALHPQDYMPAYGGDFTNQTANGALALSIGSLTDTKRSAIHRYIQAGIDLYHIMQEGVSWGPNGGHANGRALPIIYAATLLNDSGMLSTLRTVPDSKFGESGVV